jgi:threonine dehydrogenase-like Zn-dependent dehydrogenase
MRAVVTQPGKGRAWLEDMHEPTPTHPDDVLIQMLRVGVCGTDRHVMQRAFDRRRQLPDGADFLVLGHEAVGRVLETGPDVKALKPGDAVVPTVRRGCGECDACAAFQSDLCFTGRVRERGIVGLHGFLSERIVERQANLIRVADDLAEVAPLVESLCTPEKALRRIGNARAHLPTGGTMNGVHRALVTGSGPIALLAVMALRLREIPTWVLARQPTDGLAAQLVARAGATYVPLQELDLEQPQAALQGGFDAIIEATGAAEIGVAMLGALAPNGVLDLVGGGGGKPVAIKAAVLGSMVGRNLTLLGSVNANPDDWRTSVRDLAEMRQRFPGAVDELITHRFEMQDVDVAFDRVPGQIKAVIDISSA